MSDAAVVEAVLVHNAAGDTYVRFDAPEASQAVMPAPPPPAHSPLQPLAYLHSKHAALSAAGACGPVAAAAHPTRSLFVDVSLWAEPALAPTALVPTLPETTNAEAGFQQLELGDESLMERYPVLHAVRTGTCLDTQSYTRGSYQTVPVVPGGTAWDLQQKLPVVVEGAQTGRWLSEYLSGAPPSVPVMGLAPSHFAAAEPPREAPQPTQAAAAAGDAPRPTVSKDAAKPQETKIDFKKLFDDIYMGEEPAEEPGGVPPPESVAEITLADNLISQSAADNVLTESGVLESNASGKASSSVSESTAFSTAASNVVTSQLSVALSSMPPGSGALASPGAVPPSKVKRPKGRSAPASLTARNLEASGLSRSSRNGSGPGQGWGDKPASFPDEDDYDEELRALQEEEGDNVPDLPVLDDLELVLRASEPHPGSIPTPVRRPEPESKPAAKAGFQWARENTIPDVEAAFEEVRPNMAMTFPFELDHFQKEGVVLMERGHSVLVAAHTSAGKTVLAEYAFALSMLHKTKAVYTAPVKAISNQKFRDLGKDFDVGLLTGDVQIKTDAPCLIMTIEILRSMLYRGANLVRDIEWVVFDEVHYVNDDERGIVYEEVIIMLPPHVNIVMLSATVPNKMEFADWVGRTRQSQLHVCGTTKRPVPLTHNLYFFKELYPICSTDPKTSQPRFNSEAYKRASILFKNGGKMPDPNKPKQQLPTGRGGGRGGPNTGGRGGGRSAKDIGRAAVAQNARDQGGGGKSFQSDRQVWTEVIYTLRDRDLLPSIMFMFSKKNIDTTATQLSNIDLTTAEEKGRIRAFIDRSLRRLSAEDRDLPQILTMRDFLVRGIGAHHAGCLPIMKEVVEMLFCEGLLKVLFATDTFAMGVNAPARTVVFWHINKPTGQPGELRFLRPDEYVQMAGRAGRRGLDEYGTVVVVCRQAMPEEHTLQNMLLGKSEKLKSKFRLEYRMIVSLLRVRDFKVEDMLRRSFAEFHAQKAHPELLEARNTALNKLAVLRAKPWPSDMADLPSKDLFLEYVKLLNEVEQAKREVHASCLSSPAWAAALAAGAIAWVTSRPGGPPELSVVLGPLDHLAALAADEEENDLSNAKFRKFAARESKWDTNPSSQAVRGGGAARPSVIVLSLHERHATDPPPASAQDADAQLQAEGLSTRGRKKTWKPPPLPMYGESSKLGWALREVPPDYVTAFVQDPAPRRGAGPSREAAVRVMKDLQPLRVLESTASREFKTALENLRRLSREGDGVLFMPGVPAELEAKYDRLLREQTEHPVHRLESKAEAIALLQSEIKLQAMIDDLSYSLSNASLHMLPEYAVKLKVLKETDFVSSDEVVKMKGRVACEISTCECLIATEAVFRGLFTELEPAEAVALLSTLVNQHKVFSGELEGLTPSLESALEQLQQLTWQMGQLQVEAGLRDLDPEEFLAATVRPSLVQVVYLWAKGTSFKDICAVAPAGVMEGDIVRTVTRLDQACQDMMSAARVMGNTTLYDQFDKASHAIKRDVIFAGSLYIS